GQGGSRALSGQRQPALDADHGGTRYPAGLAAEAVRRQVHHAAPGLPELPQPVVVAADPFRSLGAAGDEASAQPARLQAALLDLHDRLVLRLLRLQPDLVAAAPVGALLFAVAFEAEQPYLVEHLIVANVDLRKDLR